MSRSRRRNNRTQLPFARKQVLHRWLLSLFGVERFNQLAEHLRDEALEGLDENNIHRFHHTLCLHLPADKRPELSDELLLDIDALYFELERFKADRGWYNLNLTREGIRALLADTTSAGQSEQGPGRGLLRSR